MPYEWLKDSGAPDLSGATFRSGDGTVERLHLWPNRALSGRGFAVVIGLAAGLVLVPLLATLGSPVLWGLLPFLMIPVGGLWYAIRRNWRDGQMIEELSLTPDRITLARHNPDGTTLRWEANPFWTELRLRAEGGPVEHYLTLRGGGREVELGAFLSPEERLAIHAELSARLAALRRPNP